MLIRLVKFSGLFVIWLLLSGYFHLEFLIMGVSSCLLVLWMTEPIMPEHIDKRKIDLFFPFRALSYAVWFFKELVMANVAVFSLAFTQNVRHVITPQFVVFHTKLDRPISRFVLANSITLTPGTVTTNVEEREFIVHALSRSFAQGVPGEMEKRIAAVFEPENLDRWEKEDG